MALKEQGEEKCFKVRQENSVEIGESHRSASLDSSIGRSVSFVGSEKQEGIQVVE